MNLRRYFNLGSIVRTNENMPADNSALYGYFALKKNVNSYCGAMLTIASAGTNVTLTAAQTLARLLRFTTGASGGFTITLPSTVAILAALGPTVVTDDSYGQMFSILVDGVGQTGTLTAGDASTTITGTATIATDTRRDFFMMVTGPSTLTFFNTGGAIAI